MQLKKIYNNGFSLSSMSDTVKRQVNGLKIRLKCLMWDLGNKLREGYRKLVRFSSKLRRKVLLLLTRQS